MKDRLSSVGVALFGAIVILLVCAIIGMAFSALLLLVGGVPG